MELRPVSILQSSSVTFNNESCVCFGVVEERIIYLQQNEQAKPQIPAAAADNSNPSNQGQGQQAAANIEAKAPAQPADKLPSNQKPNQEDDVKNGQMGRPYDCFSAALQHERIKCQKKEQELAKSEQQIVAVQNQPIDAPQNENSFSQAVQKLKEDQSFGYSKLLKNSPKSQMREKENQEKAASDRSALEILKNRSPNSTQVEPEKIKDQKKLNSARSRHSNISITKTVPEKAGPPMEIKKEPASQLYKGCCEGSPCVIF